MGKIRGIAFWLSLFLGGLWIISEGTFTQAGSGAGMGYYSHSFRLTLEPSPITARSDELSGRVVIEGKTPRRWLGHGGVSPQYQEVDLEWAMFSGVGDHETEGNRVIDLSTNEIVSRSGRLPLNRDNLKALFGVVGTTEQSVGFLDEVLVRLEACRSGSLPRPRHHTYHAEAPPVRSRLQHFATGISVSYLELAWAGSCLLCLLGVATVKRRRKLASRRP